MADLLGSILDAMEKPPSVGDKEKKLAREQRDKLEKQQKAEKVQMHKFRQRMQEKILTFIQDSSQKKIKFEPMDKVTRTIVHDCAEVAGLASFSFGLEEVDRYVMLWKKEFAPCDDELLAYRRGEEWSEERVVELQQQKEMEKLEREESMKRQKDTMIPVSNYKDKYEKIIGKAAAKDAAKLTIANKQYGFVPSENKTDKRSIEETMNAIREKKKQKILQPDSTADEQGVVVRKGVNSKQVSDS